MKNILIQITQNGMGRGSEELGVVLATNYLNLLSQEDDLPRFIAFYNGGVKMVCSKSPVIDILKTLEARGVKLVACKTCLNHFGILDKLQVGLAGTMMDIIDLQKKADKVISL